MDKAYQIILVQMQHYIPGLSLSLMKNKIHTLHSQLNKEWKLVRDSMRSGVGTNDIYVPKLWCYDLLKFIKEEGSDLRASRSTLDSSIQKTITSQAQDLENIDDDALEIFCQI